jgi:hypothetical protein
MHSSKETIRKAIFGRLRCLKKKLNSHGIPCAYARSILSHDSGNAGFKITFQPGTNGDATLLPQISIRMGKTIEEFDGTNFEQGLARVIELFHVAA